jgi:hypothetical protein
LPNRLRFEGQGVRWPPVLDALAHHSKAHEGETRWWWWDWIKPEAFLQPPQPPILATTQFPVPMPLVDPSLHPFSETPLGVGPCPSDGTPLGVGPCPCEACEAYGMHGTPLGQGVHCIACNATRALRSNATRALRSKATRALRSNATPCEASSRRCGRGGLAASRCRFGRHEAWCKARGKL